MDSETAARPQKEFYDAFEKDEIVRGLGVALRKYPGIEMEDRPIRLFESQLNRRGIFGRERVGGKSTVGERCRTERRIKRRNKARRHQP
jgi:hypothetical protein